MDSNKTINFTREQREDARKHIRETHGVLPDNWTLGTALMAMLDDLDYWQDEAELKEAALIQIADGTHPRPGALAAWALGDRHGWGDPDE